jgi:hypothetical protein
MMLRHLNALLLFLAFVSPSDAAAGGLVIVDDAKRDRYWGMAHGGVSFMQVGDKRDVGYGCIAVGFLIDKDGRVTAARPLRLAFGKSIKPQRARAFATAISRATSALPLFSPSADNPNRTEVFTVLAIPVFGRGFPTKMDDAKQNGVTERLRASCAISDLAAWVDTHDMRKDPEIEVVPDLDVVMP